MRQSCERVARQAQRVRLDEAGLRRLAEAIPAQELRAQPRGFPHVGDSVECRACFVLCLDTINFGSGWFPQLDKLSGLSGYRTVETHVARRFQAHGPPTAAFLQESSEDAMAELLGQTAPSEDIRELMGLFALAWRDLGGLVQRRAAGSFAGLLESAGGSAEQLVRLLLEMPLFRDAARYAGKEVLFLKRAQITAADAAALLPESLGRFHDLDRLTIFADNVVPHVLRLDGALHFDAALTKRIQAGELLEPGSTEEIEIRACAVAGVDRLRDLLGARGVESRSMDLDFWLWTRGAGRTYKAHARHRCRTPFY